MFTLWMFVFVSGWVLLAIIGIGWLGWLLMRRIVEVRWFLFQGLIVFLVVASNIHWQWTPNPTLAVSTGVGCALFATIAVYNFIAWRRGQPLIRL